MRQAIISLTVLFSLSACELIDNSPGPGNGDADHNIQTERISSFYAKEESGEIIKGDPNNRNNVKNTFNVHGKITEHLEYRDGSISRSVYNTYDSTGLLIQILNCKGESESCRKSELEYNAGGEVIMRYNYFENGSLDNYEVHEYSEGSKMVHFFNAKDSLLQFIVLEFNDDLLPESTTFFNQDELMMFRYTFEYDNDGNQTLIVKYGPEGLEEQRISMQYNRYRLVTDRTIYDSSGSPMHVFSFTYEYDEQKQWITQIQYESDTAQFYFERELEYY